MVTEPPLHAGMGFVPRQLGRPGKRPAFAAGACLWLEAGRDDQLAAVLRALGHLSTARGRPAEAIRDLTHALRLSARAGQEPGGLAAFPSSVNRRAIDGGKPPMGQGGYSVPASDRALSHDGDWRRRGGPEILAHHLPVAVRAAQSGGR
jgi:hypothetical protein